MYFFLDLKSTVGELKKKICTEFEVDKEEDYALIDFYQLERRQVFDDETELVQDSGLIDNQDIILRSKKEPMVGD